jgi:hypothetical protein
VNTGKAKLTHHLSALLTSNNTHYKFDPPPMAAQKTDRSSRQSKIWHICRTLPTLDCLSDRELDDAIDYSLDVHLPMLRAYDEGLPVHLHRKSQAAWLEVTCVTVHVCNSMTGSYLDRRQTTAMMQHINLLYRVDDFMETLIETYGIHDTAAAFGTLRRCFQPYLDLPANLHAPYHEAHKIDSPVENFPAIENPDQLKQDLQDVIERMHTYPITEAHEQDRQWYSLELYDFFVAQLQQLDSQPPKTNVPRNLHKWVTDVGARSVGTKYTFALFSCFISASKEARCWNTPMQLYLAQEFAQHVSVEFRLLNDIGGRMRDERDRTMSSCAFVRDWDYSGLMEIAGHAASCSQALLDKLEDSLIDSSLLLGEVVRVRGLLDLFRKSVRLSGELYLASEPNRVAT